MLNLELHWKAHPTTKETIIGICPVLPDSFCYFYIMRMAQEKFWVAIPSYGTDYVYERLILRDPLIARQFCQDYLNQNTRSIFRTSNFRNETAVCSVDQVTKLLRNVFEGKGFEERRRTSEEAV